MRCGIDVHKDVLVATIGKSNRDCQPKNFTAFISSWIDLKYCLKYEVVTRIAIESTGIYWSRFSTS